MSTTTASLVDLLREKKHWFDQHIARPAGNPLGFALVVLCIYGPLVVVVWVFGMMAAPLLERVWSAILPALQQVNIWALTGAGTLALVVVYLIAHADTEA